MYPQPTENKLYRNSVILLALAGIAAIVAVIYMHSPGELWKDEEWYQRNPRLLQQYGFTEEFLMKYWGPAGPLYAFVHLALKPLTGMKEPGIRLVNVLLLVLSMFNVWTLCKKMNLKNALFLTAGIMSIPMIFVCAGMALTELPAMFFATLAILLLYNATKLESLGSKLVTAFIAGIALGLAVLGRQPYLMLTVCSFALLFPTGKWRPNLPIVVAMLVGTLLITLPIFKVWGNIQPPIEEHTGKGISPFHGFLALGYGAFISFLIAPQFFLRLKQSQVRIFVTVALLITLLNIFIFKYEYLPLKGVLSNYLPQSSIGYIAQFFAAVIMLIGIFFAVSGLVRVWEHRTDLFYLFLVGACFAILISSAKITHQFSSRYVAQAAPFFILMLAPYTHSNLFRVIASVFALIIGVISLQSFLNS